MILSWWSPENGFNYTTLAHIRTKSWIPSEILNQVSEIKNMLDNLYELRHHCGSRRHRMVTTDVTEYCEYVYLCITLKIGVPFRSFLLQ